MAAYKVIQDIGAEDKLVGLLSLKQFIYGGHYQCRDYCVQVENEPVHAVDGRNAMR